MTRLAFAPVTLFGFGTLIVASATWYVAARPTVVTATPSTTTTTSTSGVGLQPTSMLAVLAATTPTPPPPDYKVLLLRSGLSPEALAAAGVQPGQIAGTVQSAVGAVSLAPDGLRLADAAYATARANTDRLKRKIQAGKAEEGDVQAYQTAKASLATATTQRETILTQVFDAATASLGESRRQTLLNIRANKSWSLPTEFLVVNRSQEEWVQLRDFLANERIAPKVGEEPDPTAQAALAQWRANVSVAAAKTGLDTHLATIRTGWTQATGD